MEDFTSIYDDLHNTKLLCKPFNRWVKNIKYTGGSGGSKNLIIIGKYDNKRIVIKCVPHYKKKTQSNKSKK